MQRIYNQMLCLTIKGGIQKTEEDEIHYLIFMRIKSWSFYSNACNIDYFIVLIYPYKPPMIEDVNSVDSQYANQYYLSLPLEGDLEGKLTVLYEFYG